MEAIQTLGTGIASFTAVLATGYGLAEMAAPKTMISIYRGPTGPMNTYLTSVMGTASTACGVGMMMTLFAEAPFLVALASSLIPWIVYGVGCVLKNVEATLGIPRSNYLFPLVSSPVIGYFCLTAETGIAHIVASVYAGFIVLNGTTLVIATQSHEKAWGGAKRPAGEPFIGLSLRLLGLRLLSYGVFMLMVGAGVNPVHAVGASWIPIAASTGLVLMSDIAKKLNVSVGAVSAWILPHLVIIAGTFLFSE